MADTREQAALLASLGAEAWCSPLALTPTRADLSAWRRRWSSADSKIVLVVGSAAAEVMARACEPKAGRITLVAADGPHANTSRNAGEKELPYPISDDTLATAVAAADVVVVADTFQGFRTSALASQFGTHVLSLGITDERHLESKLDVLLESKPPVPVDPPDAANAHRVVYGDAIQKVTELPSVAGRPSVSVIAWTNSVGRSAELATALGGEARTFYDLNITDRRLIPLRYGLSALRTAAYLVRRRPRALIVANPPIVPPLIALAYRRITGIPLLLDSQTGSFGQKSSRIGKALLPLHAWISRRCTCTLVGAQELGERVERWGAQAEIFHEAPPLWQTAAPAPLSGRPPRVLWIGIFASDEPFDALLGAAATLPDVEFRVTGDLRRAPASRASAPPNITWLGFLRGRAYPQEIQDADLVITMTTDPTSALRSAAEATFAQRPLITSDWPFLRELFPAAMFVDNDANSLAAGVRSALAELSEMRSRASDARNLHLERWERQRERLLHWLTPANESIPTMPVPDDR